MEQDVRIVLHFADDVLKQKSAAETLLAALAEHGFAPTEFDDSNSQRAWMAEFTKRLAAESAGSFEVSSDSLSASFVSVARDIPIRSAIRLMAVPTSARIGQLRELVVAFCGLGAPLDGFGHDRHDFALSGDPRVEEPMTVVDVHDAYWLLVLSKHCVAKLGKRHVLTTPAFQVVELPTAAW